MEPGTYFRTHRGASEGCDIGVVEEDGKMRIFGYCTSVILADKRVAELNGVEIEEE